VSDGFDGRQTGPVEERAGRSGKPPVPRRLPADPPPAPEGAGRHRTEQVPSPLPDPGSADGRHRTEQVPRRLPAEPLPDPGSADGRHRTEAVPFPLPPLPSPNAPASLAGPETGPLYLVGYPPRVPGAGRTSPAAPEGLGAQAPDEQDADDDR
jgi:hypothetical protein